MSSNQTGITIEWTVEGHFRCHGVVSKHDFVRLRLDAFDRRVLDGPQAQGPADLLLALELVFRRMTEQGIIGSRIPTNLQTVPTERSHKGVVDA
jgi:hypothetical protein